MIEHEVCRRSSIGVNLPQPPQPIWSDREAFRRLAMGVRFADAIY